MYARAGTQVDFALNTLLLCSHFDRNTRMEFYLEEIQKTLLKNQTVLFLIPEQSQLEVYCEALEKISQVCAYHSKLTPKRKKEIREKLSQDEIPLLLGTRTAVFLPIKNLGLIVVDEVENEDFKNPQWPRYLTGRAAQLRAELEHIPCVFGDVFLSLENRKTALSRPESFPGISPVLLPVRADQILHAELIQALKTNLEFKRKSLLYCNRLGYAAVMYCTHCRQNLRCPNCQHSWSVRDRGMRWVCPSCDKQRLPFKTCPICAQNTLKPLGYGIEKLEDELKLLFPEARILRVDSETEARAARLDQENEFDIVIGTQKIWAWRYQLKFSLLGWIGWDTTTQKLDFRKDEKKLRQFLEAQAFLEDSPQIHIQTQNPDETLLTYLAAQKIDQWLIQEQEDRRSSFWPPFCRLLLMRIEHSRESTLRKLAQVFEAEFKADEILGPLQLNPYFTQGKYRLQYLIKNPHTKIAELPVELKKYLDWDFSPVKFE